MKKHLSFQLCFALLLVVHSLMAQMPPKFTDDLTEADFKDLLSRKLLVQAVDPGLVDQSDDSPLAYDAFAKTVKNHWRLSSVEVKTEEQIERLLADAPQDYAIIYQGLIDLSFPYISFTRLENYKTNEDFRLFMPVVPQKNAATITVNLGFNSFDSYASVQIAQLLIEERLKAKKASKRSATLVAYAQERCGQLENKTLLVDKRFLHSKNSDMITLVEYPYPHEVLSEKEMIERMSNSGTQKTYAYVKVFPQYYFVGQDGSVMGNYVQLIMSYPNGIVLAAIEKSAKIPILEKAQRELRPKAIKKLVKCK